MTCGLDVPELDILFILFRNRCFTRGSSYNSRKLQDDFRRFKYNRREDGKKVNRLFERSVRNLIQRALLFPVPKKDIKYHTDRKEANIVLGWHGYPVPLGREK